jgi:hypothetical protein
MKFYGSITLVPGDNLASQFIGGYKSLASAHRKCQHCMAVASDMKTKFIAHKFQLRNRITHDYHIRALSVADTREHIQTTYGIFADSVLHQSSYFHITEGLVPDIMHDVLEGCLPYEMKEMLNHFIRHKIVSVSDLNDMILSFPYGSTDVCNKPSLISPNTLKSSDHFLKQTGNVISKRPLLLIILCNSITKLVFRKATTINYWASHSYQ